jgi:uncharacterized RDD family membrane protein YckC
MHPSEALSPRDVYGARVFAFVLDLFLVLVAAAPLAGGAGWAFALAFAFVYLGIAQGLTGWSLAKALLGIRVVRVGTTDPPGVVRGILRWVVGLVELPLPLVAGIISSLNERRHRAGDFAAGTEVVGLAPAPRVRLLAVVGYVLLLAIFVAASSFDTFLIIWAIFTPMVVAGVVVVLGQRRMKGGTLWLVGLGFALVGASLMSFQDLCKRGEGNCGDLALAHKAIPALVLLVIAIVVLFTLRGALAYVTVAVLVAVSEIWMFLRLRSGEDMAFGAVLMLILLAAQLIGEAVRQVRIRAEQRDAAAQAALPAA